MKSAPVSDFISYLNAPMLPIGLTFLKRTKPHLRLADHLRLVRSCRIRMIRLENDLFIAPAITAQPERFLIQKAIINRDHIIARSMDQQHIP